MMTSIRPPFSRSSIREAVAVGKVPDRFRPVPCVTFPCGRRSAKEALAFRDSGRSRRSTTRPRGIAVMTRSHLLLAAGIIAAAVLPGRASAQTFTVAKFSIGGDGGTDYLTAEPGTGRVFV